MCCVIYLQEQRLYQHPPKKTPHTSFMCNTAQMCYAPQWILNSTLPSTPLLWEKEQAQMCYAPSGSLTHDLNPPSHCYGRRNSWAIAHWPHTQFNTLRKKYLTRFSLHHIRVLLIKTNSSGRQSISNQIDPEQLDLNFEPREKKKERGG